MKNLLNDLKNNTIKPFYLLYGEEDYRITQFKSAFKSKFSDDTEMNTTIYNKDNFVEKDLMDFIEKMPFFADKKLIILDNIKLINEQVFEVMERCRDINVILYIINGDDVDKRLKSYKFFEKNGYVCQFNYEDEGRIKDFIIDKFKQSGKVISSINAIFLVRKVGNKLTQINTEIQKLIAYVGNRDEIEKDDIDKVVHETIDDKVIEILNCINNGDKKKAYEIYANILLNDTTQEKSSKEDIMRILLYNYNLILSIKSLRDEGKSDDYICKELNIRNFQLKNVNSIERNNDEDFFIKKIHKICEYNRNLRKDIIDRNAFIEILFS